MWSSSRNVAVGEVEDTGLLVEDPVRRVDHDLGDVIVVQQRLDRAEADDLVGDLPHDRQLVGAREVAALLGDQFGDGVLDRAPGLVRRETGC